MFLSTHFNLLVCREPAIEMIIAKVVFVAIKDSDPYTNPNKKRMVFWDSIWENDFYEAII